MRIDFPLIKVPVFIEIHPHSLFGIVVILIKS
jgi:hypothetical protein